MLARARPLWWAILLLAGWVGISTSGASLATRAANSSRPNESPESKDEFAINRKRLPTPLVSPRIIISKSKRRLMLYANEHLVRVYRVGLGTDPVKDKVKEGDRRTPEGEFYIFTKNEHSAYYLSLGLSYPNVEDAQRGLRDGLINRKQYDQIVSAIKDKRTPPQHTPLGGEIYIHGNGSKTDWTWGCVALDDADIRELFSVIPLKTPVVIKH